MGDDKRDHAGVLLDVALPLPLRRSFSYRVPAGEATPAPGSRVRVPFGATVEIGVVLGVVKRSQLDPYLRKNPGKLKEIQAVLDDQPWLDRPLLKLARWMEGYYGASLGETLRSMIPVKPLKRPRQSGEIALPAADTPLSLNPHQKEALGEIEGALQGGEFTAFLLDGVTGSGKTEVYLQAIARVIAAGKQAIVLVPEISLTPLMASRFHARLGERVGVFHSGLSAGDRYLVWQGVRRGEIDVVLGARSAVFAPFPDLGLIILDEEHDSSYKQTEKPRYHARSVALMRARDCGATVVMGSATPALESLENCRRGKYRLLQLPDRVGGGRTPAVEIVDMSTVEEELLSPSLLRELDLCRSRGEKGILLLNRRGHSRLRLCRSCGDVARCSRCDIPLTYHSRHSRRELMLCHYCGQEKVLARNCPACNEQRWVLVGAGTQQLELELGLACPGVPVFRMDADSTRRRGAHSKILAEFAAADSGVLIGTQMIAKGHHFPDVTLVGVINADTGLFLPDFRAAERSWQLLTQVAGRAGRGKRPGRVLIQTFNPTHPVLTAVADGGDPVGLIQEELHDRKQLGYPPFRPLLSLVVNGPDEVVAAKAAEKLVAGFHKHWPKHAVEILGPVPAFMPRIKDRFRQQILIKGRLGRDQKHWFADYFQEIVKSMKRSGSLSIELDVDPQSIL